MRCRFQCYMWVGIGWDGMISYLQVIFSLDFWIMKFDFAYRDLSPHMPYQELIKWFFDYCLLSASARRAKTGSPPDFRSSSPKSGLGDPTIKATTLHLNHWRALLACGLRAKLEYTIAIRVLGAAHIFFFIGSFLFYISTQTNRQGV